MRAIQQHLVAGVGVHRGDGGRDDAEGVVEHLGHRCHAVGGAGGGRDHVMAPWIVGGLVDAHDDGQVGVLAGRGDQHLLRAARQVPRGLAAGAELTGRLDDDVRAVAAPVNLTRLLAAQHRDLVPVHHQGIAGIVDRAAEHVVDRAAGPAVGGVELQQVGQRAGVGDVVDRCDLDVTQLSGAAGERAPDPAEPVDSHPRCHWGAPYLSPPGVPVSALSRCRAAGRLAHRRSAPRTRPLVLIPRRCAPAPTAWVREAAGISRNTSSRRGGEAGLSQYQARLCRHRQRGYLAGLCAVAVVLASLHQGCSPGRLHRREVARPRPAAVIPTLRDQ